MLCSCLAVGCALLFCFPVVGHALLFFSFALQLGTLHLFVNSNFCQLTFTFSDLVAHYLLRHLVDGLGLAGSA